MFWHPLPATHLPTGTAAAANDDTHATVFTEYHHLPFYTRLRMHHSQMSQEAGLVGEMSMGGRKTRLRIKHELVDSGVQFRKVLLTTAAVSVLRWTYV